MRGMFLLEGTVHEPAAADRLLARAADAGITTVFTETVVFPCWLREACHRRGLQVVAAISCFSDHAAPASHERPHLRPILETGIPRPRMEWYTGIIPTDPAYNNDLVARCADLVTEHDIDGLALDFIRWPLHWELELRNCWTQPVHASSFDPLTLRDFFEHTGVPVPIFDPSAAAALILGQHASLWTDYRCQVIAQITRTISETVRELRPDLWIGAFLVPTGEQERRSLVGQSVTEMQTGLDAFLPMAYHAILHRKPDFVAPLVGDIRSHTSKDVIPVIQTTADPTIAGGSDWGTQFESAEFNESLHRALDAARGNVVLFPAEGLDSARWAGVEAALATHTTATSDRTR